MPARTSAPTSRTSVADERGTGIVGSIVGVTVFLALLLFAVQLALNLYATSAVTAVAFDAARTVAAGDDVAAAERHARSVYGGELSFEWSLRRADVVELSVVAPQRRLLPGVSVPFDTVRRTVRVRWERLR